MSDNYDYGYDEPNSGAGEPDPTQGPKWFRDYMDKVSGQLAEVKAENDRLKMERRQATVAETLKAKGFAPNAATLYTGEPEKLDEWLGTHGDALAKLPTAPEEPNGEPAPEAPSGPPETTVPADQQNQMKQFSEAGQGAAPSGGSDKELAAAIASAKSRQEVNDLMARHGNPYDWNG